MIEQPLERFDIYDAQRNPTGRTIPRANARLADGEFRLVIHVCIFAGNHLLLIQQRQSTKRKWPNYWDLSVAGCVQAGETSQEAAMREAKEELGVSLDLTAQRPAFTVSFPHGFDDYYLVQVDAPIAPLCLQQEEVQAARWVGREDLQSLIAAKQFIPYWFLNSLWSLSHLAKHPGDNLA